jgi:hypothetical protein
MRAKTHAKEVNSTLEVLVKAINTDVDGKTLWNIISALRGPDRDLRILGDKELDMNSVKDATTCVLRYALGLNYGIQDGTGGNYWFSVNADTKAFAEYRKNIPYDHFGQHARDAFRALGLEWTKVNSKLDADKLKAKYKRRAIAKRRS